MQVEIAVNAVLGECVDEKIQPIERVGGQFFRIG